MVVGRIGQYKARLTGTSMCQCTLSLLAIVSYCDWKFSQLVTRITHVSTKVILALVPLLLDTPQVHVHHKQRILATAVPCITLVVIH